MSITATRLVVALVGVIALGALAGIILLAVLGNVVPDVLPTVLVAALTGLVGLLVPTRQGRE